MNFEQSFELEQLLKNCRDNVEVLTGSNYKLEKQVEKLLRQLSFTGLTTDELQGIHNLIKGQTNLVMNLQDKGDVSNSTSAINSLCKLVSLVSKPTG